MRLEKMVEELAKKEDKLGIVANNYADRGVEGKADNLYKLAERVRQARMELEDIADTLERQFPGHNALM